MRAGPQGEAGIGVAQVGGPLLDSDAFREQDRGVAGGSECSCQMTLLNRSPLPVRAGQPGSAALRWGEDEPWVVGAQLPAHAELHGVGVKVVDSVSSSA